VLAVRALDFGLPADGFYPFILANWGIALLAILLILPPLRENALPATKKPEKERNLFLGTDGSACESLATKERREILRGRSGLLARPDGLDFRK